MKWKEAIAFQSNRPRDLGGSPTVGGSRLEKKAWIAAV